MTCVALALLLVSGADEGEAHLRNAEKSYQAKRYNQSVEHYRSAYLELNDPRLLKIIAHIYDRTLDQPGYAITYYDLYLSSLPTDAAVVQAEREAVLERYTRVRLKPPRTEVQVVEVAKPDKGLPTLFWIGLGATAVGAGATTYALTEDEKGAARVADGALAVGATTLLGSLLWHWLVDD